MGSVTRLYSSGVAETGAAEGQKDAGNRHNAESDRHDQPREEKGGGPVKRTTKCSWGTPCREPTPNATPAECAQRDFSVIRGLCYRSECSRGCCCGRLGLPARGRWSKLSS